ncbi:MAG TPA: hypothetical protein DEQ34_05955 [Balneolaceae bacterium]|nr:hypothetical protein [Balneolaceae bacterium]|tara:strand:+ start:149405 stop:149641 length:237 start_codon:yes stop_codon:yes gene_type:complete
MYDSSFLIHLVQAKMPFGKYEGHYITELPVHYLEWFSREGFPDGQLGQYLSTMYEVKINGLEDILKPIKKEFRRHYCP